jgi:hypothetical protein
MVYTHRWQREEWHSVRILLLAELSIEVNKDTHHKAMILLLIADEAVFSCRGLKCKVMQLIPAKPANAIHM